MSLGSDVSFALTAGTLAAVNPCGFAMLPAYLVLFTADSRGPTGRVHGRALVRALMASVAMTAGFSVVFGVFGLMLTPMAGEIQRWAPVATVAIGLALAVLGAAMTAGRKFTFRLPQVKIPGLADVDGPRKLRSGRPWAMFVYGVSYAITSLGCAIAPFLAVVATTFRSGDFAGGFASYAAYAFGMGMVITAFALTTVLAKGSGTCLVRRLAPYSAKAGGVLLAVVGTYVAWFGVYELRVHAGGDPDDPVIDAGAALQTSLVHLIDDLGPTRIAVFLTLVVVVALTVGRLLRRRFPH